MWAGNISREHLVAHAFLLLVRRTRGWRQRLRSSLCLPGSSRPLLLLMLELLMLCALTLRLQVAGNATVASMINLGVVELLGHPDQLEAFKKDPEGGWGAGGQRGRGRG